jgi:phenylalanyl-tRNA synthetase beta chain
VIELFEIAKVYLPRGNKLPDEQLMLGLTSGSDFLTVKGVIEALVAEVNKHAQCEVANTSHELFTAGRSCQLRLGGEVFGYLGEVSPAGLKGFELTGPTTVAEVRLALLLKIADLVPHYVKQPAFPAIHRDLNLVVDENVRWAQLAQIARTGGGTHLEGLEYKDTYRDAERLGPGKKSLLMTITLRAPDGTLTSQQADAICGEIVALCHRDLGANLRA